MDALNSINLPGVAGFSPKVQVNNKSIPSFGDTFKGMLKDVNVMQNKADESIQKMISGEIKDVHQVMLAVGEAKVAFNLMLEIRSKLMDGYQEVMRMRA